MQLLLLLINTAYSVTEKVNSVTQTAVNQEYELQSIMEVFNGGNPHKKQILLRL
jgi:hypothetical protein